jgi:hypothetical protein
MWESGRERGGLVLLTNLSLSTDEALSGKGPEYGVWILPLYMLPVDTPE